MSVNDVRALIWRRFLYLFLGEAAFAIGLLTGSNWHPSDATTFAYCGFIFGTFAMFLVDLLITDCPKNGEKVTINYSFPENQLRALYLDEHKKF